MRSRCQEGRAKRSGCSGARRRIAPYERRERDMKLGTLKALLFSFSLLLILGAAAQAQTTFIYTDDNVFGPNSVTGFSVGATGALTKLGTFPTGGRGAS